MEIGTSSELRVEHLYDIRGVCGVISKFNFDIVVLQFPDENLADATDVYAAIKKVLNSDVELYITADSTYGSSVDDVSALHVHCKLLVYFGSDMSVSGSMPVIVCPKRLPLDITHCVDGPLRAEIDAVAAFHQEGGPLAVLVFLEPCYFPHLEQVQAVFTENIATERIVVSFGMLPGCVDLSNWDPADARRTRCLATHELIGGMLVSRCQKMSKGDLIVILGEKNDQIINICLRYSSSKIICYSPSSGTCTTKIGVELKEYRERYMGVMRVEDADVIGLIIGSMGLSGDIIQSTVNNLQKLIGAAGKKSYVLVMGRLNEAKLRNFPEIDLFCLVSNDDTSLISPKTFHIPVITPYELELGLKAREWDSTYVVGGFVGTGDMALSDADFSMMLERVKLNRKDDPIDCSDDEAAYADVTTQAPVDERDITSAVSSALTTVNTERRLANQFVSAGAEFLRSREFQGLEYSVPVNQSLEAVPGQAGIASGYTHISATDVESGHMPPAVPVEMVASDDKL